jgi:hypothetical protein
VIKDQPLERLRRAVDKVAPGRSDLRLATNKAEGEVGIQGGQQCD